MSFLPMKGESASQEVILLHKNAYRYNSYYARIDLYLYYGVGAENVSSALSFSVQGPYQGTSSVDTRTYTADNGTTLTVSIQAGYSFGYMIRLSVNNGTQINLDGAGNVYYLGCVDGNTAILNSF